MRIAIDATVLDRRMTGTGRFLYNILKELPGHDSINKYFLISGKRHDVDYNFFQSVLYNQKIIPEKLFSPVWFNYVLPGLLKKYNIDLLFAPNVLIPIVKIGKTKTIVVVHDVIFKIYKEYYPFFYRQYLSVFLPAVFKKSDMVLTVSEHSKTDIVKYYNVPPQKIDVVHNTASIKFNVDNSFDIRLDSHKLKELPEKFILYVGVIEKRKNITGLLKIIDILKKRGSNIKLVLVGRPGYDFGSIKPEIEARNDTVRYFNFLNDDEIRFIYHNAFAFVFPTFYEGFGIPPLEAMQIGLPVLTSNTSSLPEVVGNGGLMHNPDDYLGFAEDILRLDNEEDFYLEMKSRAFKQSKKINIKDTTEKLVGIFNRF